MTIRNAAAEDLDQLTEVEALCFPPAEAADRETFSRRLASYGNHFWVLEDQGKIISCINGPVTRQDVLTDEMYEKTTFHCESGKWQMIFGVTTRPEYQGQGFASRVMRRVVEEAEIQGRQGLVLTCKEKLIPFYSRFGFINQGRSGSVHGGAVWYQMKLTFDDRTEEKKK